MLMSTSPADAFLSRYSQGFSDAYSTIEIDSGSISAPTIVSIMLMNTSLLYLSVVNQDPWYAMSEFTCSVCSGIQEEQVCPTEMSSMQFMGNLLASSSKGDIMRLYLAPLSSLKQALDKGVQDRYCRSLMGFVHYIMSVDHVTPKDIKETSLWDTLTSSYSIYR
jgi:hypothetical protein